MSVLIVLISCSLLVATGFLVSFFWAVKSGQYEDDYTPSVSMLFENEHLEIETKDKSEEVKTNFPK